MRANDTFNEKVRQTWLWFMNTGYKGITDDIDTYIGHIAEAAKADRRRWAGQPVPDGGQDVADNSDIYPRRDRVVEMLSQKTNWLKGVFGDYDAEGTTTEPARDTASSLPAEYFNLQGVRIAAPLPGTLYIERRGADASLRLAR